MVVFLTRSDQSESDGFHPKTARNYYVFGIIGLGITILSVFLTYSLLVGIVSLVPLLSTTAIAFVGVVTWVVVWLLLDLAYEHYVRQRSTSSETYPE
ncbi:hypothetical protein ELS19_05805 [Halogeometricum borinquense]|uniref:Uncharacterized protein n=1 Tax=Halogeometricum borinquense TaxID=60847 RepID=A0A482TNJ7_9EURY|nr:hypothetical protein [Halogeometricum borinquense]RYJ13519.1 hypothetical protein ELS19_05805 [Halogeometricum borinquense]